MTHRLYSLILAALFLSGVPCYGAKMMNPKDRTTARYKEGPKIKVLLVQEIPSVLLEVKGDYKVFRQDTGSLLSFGHTGKRFVVHGMKDGLRWGEEYPDVYEISVVPQSPSSMFYINGLQYKGSVTVCQTQSNRITIINEVPIEEYVKSILAYRVEAPLSKESMAALVITTRTEAHFCSQNSSDDQNWDVLAKEVGYYGHGVTLRDNGVNEACDWTRHMVMRHIPESRGQGSTFAARWTSERGEHTTQKLSITGAEEMACRGYDAKKILQTYFPKTKIALLAEPKGEARR